MMDDAKPDTAPNIAPQLYPLAIEGDNDEPRIDVQQEPDIVRGKRVVHVSCAHPWSDNRVHLREAATLAAAGYRVTLVAVDRDVVVPETGVDVLRLPRRSRIARFTLGSLEAVAKAVRTGGDVFHLHDPELVWAIPILRAMGKTVIYDAHEDLPHEMADKHYIRPSLQPAFVALAHIILGFTRLSTHIVTATEKIAERYRPARVSVIHNYPRLREEDASVPPPSSRPKRIVYVGGLERVRGADPMVRALSQAGFPSDWTLDFAGEITPESLLGDLQSTPGWARVRNHGVLSPKEARDLIAQARVGLVLFQKSRAHVDALPTKMFEYMAAGVPVIASDFPLWRSIIESYDCGILVDETSPSQIAAAIAAYDNDSEMLDRHGRNARAAAVAHLNWRHEGEALVDLYDKLLAPTSSH
jgi:glycosyltransferase involved in cell wall biosynthesis